MEEEVKNREEEKGPRERRTPPGEGMGQGQVLEKSPSVRPTNGAESTWVRLTKYQGTWLMTGVWVRLAHNLPAIALLLSKIPGCCVFYTDQRVNAFAGLESDCRNYRIQLLPTLLEQISCKCYMEGVKKQKTKPRNAPLSYLCDIHHLPTQQPETGIN